MLEEEFFSANAETLTKPIVPLCEKLDITDAELRLNAKFAAFWIPARVEFGPEEVTFKKILLRYVDETARPQGDAPSGS